MAHISVHSLSSEPLDRGTRHDAGPSPVAAIIQRLSRDLSGPSAAAKTVAPEAADAPAAEAAPAANATPSIAFLSRCIVLQSIGAAGIAALWIAGLASKPFEVNGILAALITGIGLIGVVCVFLQRWRDVQWIATHVVRIGLLGTVIGLIAAFSVGARRRLQRSRPDPRDDRCRRRRHVYLALCHAAGHRLQPVAQGQPAPAGQFPWMRRPSPSGWTPPC